MFGKYKHVHFIGIGGIGMSGIADVLLTLGYEVTGSDMKSTPVTNRLRRRGAKIYVGHKNKNLDHPDVVVISSAIKDNNVELIEARKRSIPIVPRAEMLAELMRLKYGVAVAGTHGKTSTTSMIAFVLSYAGLDPTMIIGGKVNSFKTNAKLGKSDYLVAEADESDLSFLHLSPTVAVITNIDPEHMENYRNFRHMTESYLTFANKVPFYGCIVAGIDHPEVKKLKKRMKRRVITYALDKQADFTASDIRQVEDRLQFMVSHKDVRLGAVRLNMVGRHNVSNALAAVAVGMELGVPFLKIGEALSKFKGIERRFQILKRGSGPWVVADYAHHPVEIDAVINAARDGWPEKRLVFVHQPHRYTRLKSLFKDFVKILSKADHVVLLPIYAAGEKPIKGIGSMKLYASLKRSYPKLSIDILEDNGEVVKWMKKNSKQNDLLVFSGAGDIWKTSKEAAKSLKR